MSMLDALAAFVSAAKASDLPPHERSILRRHSADIVAARLAGAACSEGKAVAALHPPGQGADSIAGMATIVRLTETDDIHTPTGTTPSSVAVPVALALAAESTVEGEQLESAIYVGLETIVRLGEAAGGAAIHYRGVWPTRAGATLGAAATACRIWGLTEQTTKNALSLAVILSSGRSGRFQGEPSGRWIVFSVAVATGIRAAMAARAGFGGDPDVLDNGGLERALGVPVDARLLVGDLGRTSVYPELSLKPYCTSRQALSGAEAMRALVAEGLSPNAIEAFTIHVPTAYAGMISQQLDPAMRSSAYVSGAGLAAIAALDPDALYDVERENVLRDPRIMALAAKGQVVADGALDKLYPARWPARIEVTTASGKLQHEMLEPSGGPGNPIGDDQLNEKTRRILGRAGLTAAVEPWLAVTKRPFESKASATSLARFFVKGGAS